MYTNKLQSSITPLIEFSHDTEKFDRMLQDTSSIDVFRTFVTFCLAHCCKLFKWRYTEYNTKISKFFTELDKALAMLFLDNITEDLTRVTKDGKPLTRKESKPKYTKLEN